jgi:hypothetical protein
MYKCPKCGLRYVGGGYKGQVHPRQRCDIHGALTVWGGNPKPKATVPTCSIVGCNKTPVKTVRIMGRWENVCEAHSVEGWTTQDSVNHMVETLQGRRA